jgi:hypothetical protein
MKSAKPLLEVLLYHSRLMKTKTRHYYLFLPKPVEVRSENQAPIFKEIQESMDAGILALDTGVRTFQTCFEASLQEPRVSMVQCAHLQ